MRIRRRRRAKVEDFLPPGVTSTFARMAIAEEEIREAYPQKADEPPGLFLVLTPSPLLENLRPEMYRAHARELVTRSRSRRPDYSPATEPEILAALLQAATHAPLNRAGQALADELWRRIMGWTFDDDPAREEWPGQFNEELTAARRRVRTGR